MQGVWLSFEECGLILGINIGKKREEKSPVKWAGRGSGSAYLGTF